MCDKYIKYGETLYKNIILIEDGTKDDEAIKYSQLETLSNIYFDFEKCPKYNEFIPICLSTTTNLTNYTKIPLGTVPNLYEIQFSSNSVIIDGVTINQSLINNSTCDITILVKNELDFTMNNIYKAIYDSGLDVIKFQLLDEYNPWVYKNNDFYFYIKSGLSNGAHMFYSKLMNFTSGNSYATQVNYLSLFPRYPVQTLDTNQAALHSHCLLYQFNPSNNIGQVYYIENDIDWFPNNFKVFHNSSTTESCQVEIQNPSTVNLRFVNQDTSTTNSYTSVVLPPNTYSLYIRNGDSTEIKLISFTSNTI